MYPTRPGLLIGFHGCEEAIRDDIITGRRVLNPSQNRYDWLGNGSYFWENNYERAWDFASNPPGKKKIDSPAVLGAVIDLQYCLDLLDSSCLNMVKYAYSSFVETAGAIGRESPANRSTKDSKDLLIRELDCSVIEYLHLRRSQNGLPPFDSVRGVFIEGRELYPGAGFHDKNHIQICLRNPNCIKGFFLPRKEIRWPMAA